MYIKLQRCFNKTIGYCPTLSDELFFDPLFSLFAKKGCLSILLHSLIKIKLSISASTYPLAWCQKMVFLHPPFHVAANLYAGSKSVLVLDVFLVFDGRDALLAWLFRAAFSPVRFCESPAIVEFFLRAD